ncbi:nitrite reductase (NAD(P)H) small subunit [Streptomyces cinnamoneus]|uniref:Nitrite reductase (NAD(P)H) small subunit n=1 Tax=Streptomyces cinnamoneus TaxID=53446 RepID=A0A2G1XNN0_STRCJ|nr:nitrite reductase (NAD(P)H) small subunit [Streptomyces cinnamoneus]PPT11475.1 nitrite reductase (NAD(P)H) small subunit [Streptomyces cinnamoneus]
MNETALSPHRSPRPDPDALVEIGDGTTWTTVCRYGDLTPGRGVTALVGGEQVALFRDPAGALYALANRDPFSDACVISRGIMGSRDGTPAVTSPMYKQTFDLRTGACLDEETAPDGSPAALRAWAVRTTEPAPPARGRTLPEWRPEDPAFWEATGARVARRNLWLSVLTEHIGFSVWSMWSVLVLFLGPEYGIDPAGKFTLTAVPTALGAVLRVPYTYAVARFGGRNWTVFSGLLLLVPTAYIALVLQPGVSYTTLLTAAAVAGVGGGNFASSMANINAFYPQRLKGRALGVNAGGGNLGVPAVQLAGLLVLATAGAGHPRLLPLAYVPLIALTALVAALRMDNLPAGHHERPAMGEVLGDRHAWALSLLYLGTFGSFVGFAFAFGQVLQVQFHDEFDTPVKAACLTFLGPLLGSLSRPLGGAWADRLGGGRVTTAVFLAMAGCAGLILVAAQHRLLAGFFAGFLTLFVLSGVGNGSTYRMIPALYAARARAAVRGGADARTAEAAAHRRTTAMIGLAGAFGTFGGVLVNVAFRQSFLTAGNGDAAYAAFLVFYLACAALTVVLCRRGRAAAHI